MGTNKVLRGKVMKKIISIIGSIIFVGSIVIALYVGGWSMFIQPILEACRHFDAGTLTGVIIGTTVLKCVFASAVGSIIVYVGALIASVFKAVSK